MYQRFYNLGSDPFRLTPDPNFRFRHRSYTRAKAYLRYALQRGEGFTMVTGLPGTGKSTLIKEVIDELDSSRVRIAALNNTQVNAVELLRLVAYALDIRNDEMDKATLLYVLENFLKHQHSLDKRVLLFVDEAQDLGADGLEELRLLTNMELNGSPLIQFLLVGQQQLAELMSLPELDQVRQRIIAASRLEPLDLMETEDYIYYRLNQAGWQQDPIICYRVIQAIYNYTQGIPRRINQLCSRLFLYGFVEGKREFEYDDIATVIAELDSENLTPVNYPNNLDDKIEVPIRLHVAPGFH